MITDPSERSRLLSQLQRQLRERLAPHLETLFDELDARLFDLAERSRAGAQQHAYFDGLRECRRKRADVERDFLETVVGALRVASPEGSSAPRAAGLSLVAYDELEETLALSALADRTAARHSNTLDALDRRLGMLLNQPRVPDATPRLGPHALGAAFRAACQRLDVGIEIRLIAHTLFGHHVFDALGTIYEDINRDLVAAGVLPAIAAPKIRASPAPATRNSPSLAATATRQAERARDAGALRYDRDDDEALQQLLDDLRDLLASRGAEGGGDAGGDASPQVARQARSVLPADLVLDALERLTHFNDEPRNLKSELIAASRRLGSDSQAMLHVRDEDTVDLIGMVFDFVRHDPDLPQPLQPLIARLQVPFLKAALSDPELMSAASHPARRLIDELGEVALGWTPATDPDGQLLARIAQTVEALLQQHEAGRAPFERAITELQGFIEMGRHRAELAEQRAVETALGRERLRIARSRVAGMLDRRLSRYAPLPWIRQLLRGPWANYLVLLWLRQGETGESYREAFAFVDELLWCDEHGSTSTDDARLQADELELEEDLRHGLSTVAYHDREIERLAGELRQFIASLRRRAKAPAFLYEIDPKLGTSDFSQSWNENELEEQPGADQVDSALLARLRALPPGTWFEFGARSTGERAKLSWSSPFTGRCLFVNRNGLRVNEIAPERLAEEIEQGLARILENTRLLQRALQTLLAQARARGSHSQRSA